MMGSIAFVWVLSSIFCNGDAREGTDGIERNASAPLSPLITAEAGI